MPITTTSWTGGRSGSSPNKEILRARTAGEAELGKSKVGFVVREAAYAMGSGSNRLGSKTFVEWAFPNNCRCALADIIPIETDSGVVTS